MRSLYHFKLLIFLSIFFVFQIKSTKLNAQNWGQIGTKWHYSYIHWNPNLIGYVKLEIIGDSVINGINSKIIEYFQPIDEFGNNIPFYDTFFVYESNNIIYYFDTVSTQFVTLYDFNKNGGEFWIVPMLGIDSVFVDSTEIKLFNSTPLKVQYVHSNTVSAPFYIEGAVIERIGNEFYFLPHSDCIGCPAQLRCYEDSVIGLYNTGVYLTCDTIVTSGMNEYSENNSFYLFPNPIKINETLNIKYLDKIDKVELFTLEGKLFQTIHSNDQNNILNYQFDKSGVYFIKISNLVKKIIVLN